MTVDTIIEEIRKADSIVIITHENPDGDAIGSCLAMYEALKQKGKNNVDVVIPEYPRTYNYLSGSEIVKKEGKDEPYDLAISLDCATLARLNVWGKYFETAKEKIVIDHHGSNSMYGDINYVNPDSPACCQVLLNIFEYSGIEITKEIGESILTGIITDTGGFQYQSTRAETFEFAAKLIKAGINVADIYKKSMNTKTRANFELRRRAIDRMEFLEDGKISFTYITKKDLEETNAGIDDHEGIVNEGKDVEGVEVSIFVREQEEGEFRASLRSNNQVNVSDACMIFGGGGHIRAAGCTIQGNIEQVKEKLVNQIKLQLK